MLFSIFSFYFSVCSAQTATLFSSSGVHKGTYTKIADALAASVDKDSIVLSAHTFYEHDLLSPAYKYLVLQGTIAGTDTTTINANKNGFCIKGFSGTIRDMVFTGAVPVLNSSGIMAGCPIFSFAGLITGYTTIRDNISSANSIVHYSGNLVFDGNIKIVNNKVYHHSNPLLGCILIIGDYYGLNIDIKGNMLIAYNTVNNVIIDIFGKSKGGDTNVMKANSSFKLGPNLRIENNVGRRSGGILIRESGYLELSGATIVNNRATEPGWGAAIIADTGTRPASSIPYDSVGVPLLRIRNSRIYNPLPDGRRQTEVQLLSRRGSTSPKPCYFYSDGCWWGSNDTSGLFQMDPGTTFKLHNWAVSQWYAKPYGTASTSVRAQLRLNTGAALPDSSLRSIEGQYFSTAGYFTPTIAPINKSNLVASDFYYPSSGAYAVTAVIDADTFRPTKEELTIREQGFAQVNLHPNPTSDYLFIEGVEKGDMVELFDLNGRIVKGFIAAQTGKQEMDIRDFAAGVYNLKISNYKGIVGTTKVVKE